MFGILRTILALLVLFSHFGGGGGAGGVAVFAFFTLSGFLMTHLMNTTYKDRLAAYAANRFLRIYPAYWLTMAVTALLLVLGLKPSTVLVGIPQGWDAVRHLFYLDWYADRPQLVTTAWAVTNEMVYYVLIGLGISRTVGRTWVWFLLSAAYILGAQILQLDEALYLYFSPLAPSAAFAVGALAFHYREKINSDTALIATVCGAALMLISIGAPVDGQNGRSLAVLSAALLVLGLYHVSPSAAVAKVDRLIGGLSYHVYLNHFAAAMILLFAVPSLEVVDNYYHLPRTPQTGAMVAAISILMALTAHLVLDKTIDRLRDRIRRQGSKEALVASQASAP